MKSSTREMALAGVFCALSVVLLCLGGIIPFLAYACPVLASAALIPVRDECRKSFAVSCYAATAILGLILCPDKEAALLYLVLGYYPLIKDSLDCIHPAVSRYVIKILLFVISVTIMYALLALIMGLETVMLSLTEDGMWMAAVTLLLAIAVFLVFDAALVKLTLVYRRFRKKSKNN